MKILIIILMAISLFGNIKPITGKIYIGDKGWLNNFPYYIDYCDHGYVWRYYYYGYNGSYSQVFETRKVHLDKTDIDIGAPKRCK